MDEPNAKFRPGEWVEVRTSDEILRTLDSESAIDHLPFMPEMLQFCGHRFRVAERALMTCFYGPGSPRRFRGDDVVTLDGLRCSGAAHNGCQKACTIFWREAWLRKTRPGDDARSGGGNAPLQLPLKTTVAPNVYYCQASELAKAADPLSRGARIRVWAQGFGAGNSNALQLARMAGIWLSLRLRKKLFGDELRGGAHPSPTESLDLQPGEWVEVKPIEDIVATLNERGQNRGLQFTPDMRRHCGRRYRVKSRLDRIIVDGTGAERQLKNTVLLEGTTCGCGYLGLGMGGCSRREVTYWREIWLHRVPGPLQEGGGRRSG